MSRAADRPFDWVAALAVISAVAVMIPSLAALAADNVRIGRTGLLPEHRRKLEMFGRMAAAVPVFRLEAGSDLSRLGPVLLEALSLRETAR